MQKVYCSFMTGGVGVFMSEISDRQNLSMPPRRAWVWGSNSRRPPAIARDRPPPTPGSGVGYQVPQPRFNRVPYRRLSPCVPSLRTAAQPRYSAA